MREIWLEDIMSTRRESSKERNHSLLQPTSLLKAERSGRKVMELLIIPKYIILSIFPRSRDLVVVSSTHTTSTTAIPPSLLLGSGE